MIESGSFRKNGREYDRRISPSDWRYSASALGMIRFFEWLRVEYDLCGQYLYYNYDKVFDVDRKNYLRYVEANYPKKMHHKIAEEILLKKDPNEEDYKLLKAKLSATVTLKRIFKDVDHKSDPNKIQSLIDENREELIKETYRNAETGYKKFASENKFGTEQGDICRLHGYYTDIGRKTKSLSFGFDDRTRVYHDEAEFDYIPFAFTDEREAIFINNNYSMSLLFKTNAEVLKQIADSNDERINYRNMLFFSIAEGSEFIDYDVEIITKSQGLDHFESLFVRKESIDIFRRIRKLKNFDQTIHSALKVVIKQSDDNYLNIMNLVTDCVVNLLVLDSDIEQLLKSVNQSFLVAQLIRMNRIIYEKLYHKEGSVSYIGGYANVSICAKAVKEYLKKKKAGNKINSYRYRLISSLVANDRNRFMEVMLQLSSYTEVPFYFLHDLITDFDKHRNLAYDFINQLNDYKLPEKNKGEEYHEK